MALGSWALATPNPTSKEQRPTASLVFMASPIDKTTVRARLFYDISPDSRRNVVSRRATSDRCMGFSRLDLHHLGPNRTSHARKLA
jgi:hypothetical protein